MVTETNIEETLRSAREAYRFLHEFQKRLRDTIERFRQEFPGHVYCASGPIYTDKPSFQKSPHDSDKWALDLFPAFAYSMQYQKQEKGERSSLLEICFYCDDEFEAEEDALPTESQNSKTKIKVYLWIKDKELAEPFKWRDEWYQTDDYPNLGEVDEYPKMEMKVMGLELNFHKLGNKQGIVEEADRVKKELKKHLNYVPTT